ncbi:MAG TPA: DUF2059 domain-containing protein [Smithella sp.]|nr:DUF2059 domain-containing protein [Smithella sp.]
MRLLRITVTLLIISIATTAMAVPASENSIKQLLAVTQAQKLSEKAQDQVNTTMDKLIQQALNGRVPTASQQQAITRMKDRLIALMQKELAWEKMEPVYIRLYKESFTEEEVAGMISFYQTAAGKAVINKLPVLMQKVMQEMQKIIIEAVPEMNKIEKDFVDDMKAANN